MKKTPEEISALKAKYAVENEAKQRAKADKKEKFRDKNFDQNMPTIEMRIPWESEGREIDLEKPPWNSYCDSLESLWRFGIWLDTEKYPEYPIKRKIIRT